MGYGGLIRVALDDTASPGRRYCSLRQAVGYYCPLGYHATWAYVTAEARPDGQFGYDVAAMTRAVTIMQRSRAFWLAELRLFDERRTAEKRVGRRRPRAAETRALRAIRWPGGPNRLGLLAAVSAVHREFSRQYVPDELAEPHARLEACAATYIRRLGYLAPAERHDLLRALESLPTPPGRWRQFAELLRYAAVNDGDVNA
ncbi:hypothetical protein HPO96_28455 [Kribbella sandramycini]|uniref:Uncharacterized protein n=1 Tax=Kribbella sandramycini TaxID=60450 RepID=A0A7Y4L6G3_9ACTN|nr:hypothetical protein [Kribbella sandramycini]MBB6571537.1 hypothetical protein [Kribbella sandramycini]NOL44186.1 hypothetical protein [Kribbella sandramycini]